MTAIQGVSGAPFDGNPVAGSLEALLSSESSLRSEVVSQFDGFIDVLSRLRDGIQSLYSTASPSPLRRNTESNDQVGVYQVARSNINLILTDPEDRESINNFSDKAGEYFRTLNELANISPEESDSGTSDGGNFISERDKRLTEANDLFLDVDTRRGYEEPNKISEFVLATLGSFDLLRDRYALAIPHYLRHVFKVEGTIVDLDSALGDLQVIIDYAEQVKSEANGKLRKTRASTSDIDELKEAITTYKSGRIDHYAAMKATERLFRNIYSVSDERQRDIEGSGGIKGEKDNLDLIPELYRKVTELVGVQGEIERSRTSRANRLRRAARNALSKIGTRGESPNLHDVVNRLYDIVRKEVPTGRKAEEKVEALEQDYRRAISDFEKVLDRIPNGELSVSNSIQMDTDLGRQVRYVLRDYKSMISSLSADFKSEEVGVPGERLDAKGKFLDYIDAAYQASVGLVNFLDQINVEYIEKAFSMKRQRRIMLGKERGDSKKAYQDFSANREYLEQSYNTSLEDKVSEFKKILERVSEKRQNYVAYVEEISELVYLETDGEDEDDGTPEEAHSRLNQEVDLGTTLSPEAPPTVPTSIDSDNAKGTYKNALLKMWRHTNMLCSTLNRLALMDESHTTTDIDLGALYNNLENGLKLPIGEEGSHHNFPHLVTSVWDYIESISDEEKAEQLRREASDVYRVAEAHESLIRRVLYIIDREFVGNLYQEAQRNDGSKLKNGRSRRDIVEKLIEAFTSYKTLNSRMDSFVEDKTPSLDYDTVITSLNEAEEALILPVEFARKEVEDTHGVNREVVVGELASEGYMPLRLARSSSELLDEVVETLQKGLAKEEGLTPEVREGVRQGLETLYQGLREKYADGRAFKDAITEEARSPLYRMLRNSGDRFDLQVSNFIDSGEALMCLLEDDSGYSDSSGSPRSEARREVDQALEYLIAHRDAFKETAMLANYARQRITMLSQGTENSGGAKYRVKPELPNIYNFAKGVNDKLLALVNYELPETIHLDDMEEVSDTDVDELSSSPDYVSELTTLIRGVPEIIELSNELIGLLERDANSADRILPQFRRDVLDPLSRLSPTYVEAYDSGALEGLDNSYARRLDKFVDSTHNQYLALEKAVKELEGGQN